MTFTLLEDVVNSAVRVYVTGCEAVKPVSMCNKRVTFLLSKLLSPLSKALETNVPVMGAPRQSLNNTPATVLKMFG